jgi:TRAP-type C4-dicarboxylate transport system permease small subunit
MSTFRAWLAVRRIGEWAIVTILAVMVAAAMGQVVSRYVFNAPLVWSEELSRYLFIWLSFLGAWYAWIEREHLGFDMLPDFLPKPLVPVLRVLVEALVLLFAIASMYYGQRILPVSARQPSAVLRVPMVWIYVSYYVAMTLIAAEIVIGWIHYRLYPESRIKSAAERAL